MADPMSHASFMKCLTIFLQRMDRSRMLLMLDDRVEQSKELRRLGDLANSIKECVDKAFHNFHYDRNTWLEETMLAEDQEQLRAWKHGEVMEDSEVGDPRQASRRV